MEKLLHLPVSCSPSRCLCIVKIIAKCLLQKLECLYISDYILSGMLYTVRSPHAYTHDQFALSTGNCTFDHSIKRTLRDRVWKNSLKRTINTIKILQKCMLKISKCQNTLKFMEKISGSRENCKSFVPQKFCAIRQYSIIVILIN